MTMIGAGQMAGSLVKGWLSRGVLKPSQVMLMREKVSDCDDDLMIGKVMMMVRREG